MQFLALLQSAQKSGSGKTHTENEDVTWNKTNKPGQSSQHKQQQQWSQLSLTNGFDFFFYFSHEGMEWIIMILSTYDNVQSWLNPGEPEFSFISPALADLQSKRTKAYLLSILHLYILKELLMPLGQNIAAAQLTDILQMEQLAA